MLEQGSRYLFVGIVSAAIDFGGFLFFERSDKLEYPVVQRDIIVDFDGFQFRRE